MENMIKNNMNIYLVTVGWVDRDWEPISELIEAPTSIFAVNNMMRKHKRCELKDVRLVETISSAKESEEGLLAHRNNRNLLESFVDFVQKNIGYADLRGLSLMAYLDKFIESEQK